MSTTQKYFQILVIFFAGFATLTAQAGKKKALNFSSEEMKAILKIAKSIHVLNPRLDDSKYMEYATGIHKASQKYGIDTNILVAIAQRETEYREDLPEGAAGEHGICQIRKMWLKNKFFIKEFGNKQIEDLDKPAKNFMFAAWILKDLKKSVSKGSLPYWSFYNAVKFEPRFRYFLGVNRNIATLLRANVGGEEAVQPAKTTLVAERRVELMPPRRPAAKAEVAVIQPPKLVEVAAPAKRENVGVDRASFSSDVQDLVEEGNHWIPDALQRLQKEKEQKKKNQQRQAFMPYQREVAQND